MKKVGGAARSLPELEASLRRAVRGTHVEHIESVVDFWRTAEPRHLRYELSKSFAFQIRKNHVGIVCFRTKDAMRSLNALFEHRDLGTL